MEFEDEKEISRQELLQRVALMEAMIAEGRRSTCRHGWIFVLWGLVNLAGMVLEWNHPRHMWNWPVVIGVGLIIQFAVFWLRRRGGPGRTSNLRSRAIGAVWGMMGLVLILYCFTAIFAHKAFGSAYFAAIFFIIGLAHATSAILLRWRAQGAVAALWWAGGIASFFVNDPWFAGIFFIEMLFGMVLFGIYMMALERRNTPPSEAAAHA